MTKTYTVYTILLQQYTHYITISFQELFYTQTVFVNKIELINTSAER